MAKCIFTPAVLEALKTAQFNGNKIADLVVTEIENDNEMVSKSACNYFDIKFEPYGNSMTWNLTACLKDTNHPQFPDKSPDAAWKSAYRQSIGISLLISRFGSVRKALKQEQTIPESEMQFLSDLLALPKLKIRIGETYEDFCFAYNGINYCSYHSDNTLHNSCMRHENVYTKASDFYANCAKNKIVIVEDEAHRVYGRALLWENILIDGKKETLLDRVYYSDKAVMTMIYRLAEKNGWIHKEINSYDSKEQFVRFVDGEWQKFHSSKAKWMLDLECPTYNAGCGYLDTMSYLVLDNDKLYLTNNDDASHVIATCCSTNGFAQKHSSDKVCPICGQVHYDSHSICDSCLSDSFYSITSDIIIPKHIVMIDGKPFPTELLDNSGKIKKSFFYNQLISKIARY